MDEMMHKTFFKIALVLLLLGIFMPQQLAAQNDFEGQLRRFDRFLERVRNVVTSFNNLRGIQLVNEAEALRNSAGRDFQNRDFDEAQRKIKMAMAKLELALKVTLDGPIRRLRSQVDALLQRAEQEVLGRNHKEAERLIEEARNNRAAAEQALKSRQIQKAVEHFRVAKNLAQRALDMVDAATDKIAEERRKFEALRERARELIERSDDERARQIFNQAMRLGQQAEDAVREGNYTLAKKFYNQSVLLLLRAIDMVPSESVNSVDRVEVELFRLRESLERAHPVVSDAAGSRANLLYERAKRFASEAEVSLKEGRNNEALWRISLADKMVQRALRMARSGSASAVSDKIAHEIENTRNDIELVRESQNVDAPADAEVLLGMSESMLQRAERAAAAGQSRLALEAVLISQRFLTRADKMLLEPASSEVSKQIVTTRLAQLDAAISDAESTIDPAETWNRRLLENAQDLRQFAYDSLQKGHLNAAHEGIQVAFELLRKSQNITNE